MATKNLILDTNVLVLLAVGLTDKKYVSLHKRTKKHDLTGFYIVQSIMSRFDSVILVPHVLAETSNLIRNIHDAAADLISIQFANMIINTQERFIASSIAVRKREYKRLGLTDAILLEASSFGCHLLTDDLDLYLAALSSKLQVTNYSHVREQRPDFR